jgi:nucleotide-binding universal stress UspA family protein
MKMKATFESGSSGAASPETPSTQPPAEAIWRCHRILVPLDFSDNSLHGLAYACTFAERLKARVSVVNVVEPIAFGADAGIVPSGVAEQTEVATTTADAVAREHACKLSSGPIETIVRTGSPPLEVCEAARERDADLIVMSTHGYSGWKHVLFGGITDGVVRHAPCPVLVVRSMAPTAAAERSSAAHELRRVLVPIDFSEHAEAAVRYAAGLAAECKASVSLVYVFDPGDFDEMALSGGADAEMTADASARLHSLMERLVPEAQRGVVFVRRGVPFAQVAAVANLHEADLVVLTTHGRTGLGYLLMGSTAEKILHHVSSPALIVRTA